jgi:hypothetical protein
MFEELSICLSMHDVQTIIKSSITDCVNNRPDVLVPSAIVGAGQPLLLKLLLML